MLSSGTGETEQGGTVDEPDGGTVSAELRRELTAWVPQISAHLRRAHTDMPPVIREMFAAAGLGPRHGAVLGYVLSSGPASVSEVARQLGLSLTNASQLSGELTRAGLVRRHSDPADHRRTLLSAVPEYRAAFQEFLDRRGAALFRAMERLTPEQRDGFAAGLRVWAEELERSGTTGPPGSA